MSQANPKLARAELEKWHRDLNAREIFLDEREALLKSGPIELEVLEKTIKAREQDLLAIKGRVIEAERDLNARKEAIVITKEALTTELEAENRAISTKEVALKKIVAQCEERSVELAAFDAEIAERQDYAKRQEITIAKASEAGNDALVSLKYQIEEQERQKSKLALLLSDLNREKITLEASLLPLRKKALDLQATYDKAATNLRNTLDDMREQIAQAGNRYKKIEADSATKLTELKVHEESILAQREAINNERLQLDTDKRRWNSTKGLYKVE